MPNQFKPAPPLELVEPHIRRFHQQSISFDKMVSLLEKHYDTHSYSLRKTKLKTYAKALGLPSARSQAHTFDTIAEPIAEIRKMFPRAGAEMLRTLLRNRYNMYVSRDKIRRYLKLPKPNLAAGRRANRSVRRATGPSPAAGVNHVWAMSRHDKWERFGLFWHGCVDGFSGKIFWLEVWWNNSNPKYVCAQYLKAVQNFGGTFSILVSFFVISLSNTQAGVPRVTQSGKGTENHNVVHAHTHIRHTLDPQLSDTIQHRWAHGDSTVNHGPMWWLFRKTWVPGFEDILEKGITNQWYNADDIADSLVFRWLAIPWLQKEADSFVYRSNTSRRRANRQKVVPNGIPDAIYENPETVDALDYKITVPDALIEEAEQHWAPPTDPIFDLVPPDCEELISSAYAQIGSPAVGFDSFWEVYNALRDVVDSDTLRRYPIDAPEEDACEGADGRLPLHHLHPCELDADGIRVAHTVQDEDMPEIYVEFTDEDEDGTLAARNVQDEDLPELCVEFTDEDEQTEEILMVEFTDDEGDELF